MRLTTALALAAALTTAIVAAGTAGAATTPSVVKVTALASGLKYNTKVLHAHPGKIKLVFTNQSMLQHNVRIESGETELGGTKKITQGADRRLRDAQEGDVQLLLLGAGSRGRRHARHADRLVETASPAERRPTLLPSRRRVGRLFTSRRCALHVVRPSLGLDAVAVGDPRADRPPAAARGAGARAARRARAARPRRRPPSPDAAVGASRRRWPAPSSPSEVGCSSSAAPRRRSAATPATSSGSTSAWASC